MTILTRRKLLQGAAATALIPPWLDLLADEITTPRLATFVVDVTPPLGSPLCGGLVKPVAGVNEPLRAMGIVLLGGTKPVVLCAVDWCEIHNRDHLFWRNELAQAAGTTADQVAVQSLHQHDAPIADTEADSILAVGDVPLAVHNLKWHAQTVATVAKAVHESLKSAQPLTHIACGEAKVSLVASNRRVMGPDGRVQYVRTSATKDAKIREAPEGLIDPMLKTLVFRNGEKALAVLHYYATHPMSFYGDGIVSCDFVGMARDRRTERTGIPNIYFTGCGGNVTAGKYNDGNPANRPALCDRLERAMQDAENNARAIPVTSIAWRVSEVVLPARTNAELSDLIATAQNSQKTAAIRIGAATQASYQRTVLAGGKIALSCLHIGNTVRVLHLPGEPFVEYQLFAQQEVPDKFVCVAGYGDVGPGYIPLEHQFAEGGYEPTWAFATPESEMIIKQACVEILR